MELQPGLLCRLQRGPLGGSPCIVDNYLTGSCEGPGGECWYYARNPRVQATSTIPFYGVKFDFQIPPDLGLAGQELRTQAVSLDPNANALGVLTTNGLVTKINTPTIAGVLAYGLPQAISGVLRPSGFGVSVAFN